MFVGFFFNNLSILKKIYVIICIVIMVFVIIVVINFIVMNDNKILFDELEKLFY